MSQPWFTIALPEDASRVSPVPAGAVVRVQTSAGSSDITVPDTLTVEPHVLEFGSTKLSLLLLLFAISISLFSQQQNDIYQKLEAIAIIDQKVMMPMRDGIRLATDIYRPKGNGKVPIVFSRTPYNFNTWGDGEMRTRGLEAAYDAVQRGYAYVVQNERGRFFSEGEWDILGTPTTDGYDAFEWMSKQPWSNGKIGVY